MSRTTRNPRPAGRGGSQLDNDDPTWAQAWRQERQATLIPGLGISALAIRAS